MRNQKLDLVFNSHSELEEFYFSVIASKISQKYSLEARLLQFLSSNATIIDDKIVYLGTYREIAEKSHISYNIVAHFMRNLQRSNLIFKRNNAVYELSDELVRADRRNVAINLSVELQKQTTLDDF